MGSIRNILSGKVSGNVGSMSFRKRGSQVVVAERSFENKSAGEGASESQRSHRSRMANIVSFFRTIKAIESRAWEDRKGYTSDFNMFCKLNLSSSRVWLTKDEATCQASIIAPYIVSRGSLPALLQAFVDKRFMLGLSYGFASISEYDTLGVFSQRLVEFNRGWEYGDKLSICLLRQVSNTISNFLVPQIEAFYLEITLDAESSLRLDALENWASFGLFVDANKQLGCAFTCDAGFAIHSRRYSSGLRTSEQHVILLNPLNALYTKYTGVEQQQRAMSSYGYRPDVLLTPGSESSDRDGSVAKDVKISAYGVSLKKQENLWCQMRVDVTGENLSLGNISISRDLEPITPVEVSRSRISFDADLPGAYMIAVNGVFFKAYVRVDPEDIMSLESITWHGEPLLIPPFIGDILKDDDRTFSVETRYPNNKLYVIGDASLIKEGTGGNLTFTITDDGPGGILICSTGHVVGAYPAAE